ncbi:hypothetical protein FQR65_LT04063 [Abscondita terminalis]|nr:hypothetical protein FQR65_LT04063 [Abscondita terminalis]
MCNSELSWTPLEGGETGSGMDCIQLRQSAGPFHYLINEQAKSLVALQELQHEVGALLEFRDLVIETFPNLRTKLANSTPTTMTSHPSNIPIAVRREWEPGVRVRRKLISKEEARGNSSSKKNGETGVQDSGFSTEASSKETHSASSTVPPPSATAMNTDQDESEDELWNLLDVIHRKGTRLKDELEALQDSIREGKNAHVESNSDSDFQRVLLHASVDDVRHLKRERDLLMERVAEMEAELLAGRVQTSRLQEDLENLISAKQDLEEQLRAVMTQSGEVNTRIHDLHSQFVTNRSAPSSPNSEKTSKEIFNVPSASQRTRKKSNFNVLDNILGDRVPKIKSPDSKKITAILKEHDPLVLQRHLLTSTVENQVLQQQLTMAARLEIGLVDKLDKAREENEDLKFQLEDKNIELEGTRARVRLFEQLQRPIPTTSSPDVIPNLESVTSDNHDRSRSEITTASMKAMSPLPMNLQFDHSSSTESAHDQAESARKGEIVKKRPSKIPLVKSYAAPKPPGGKHSPAPDARSRSGESPGRPHSAQSVRNKSEANSLSGSKSNTSLSKSRNTSLSNTKDSLTGKLRSVDSLSKLRDSSVNASITSNRSTKRDVSLKKSSAPTRRTNSIRDTPDAKMDTNSAKEKSQSPWILSSFNFDSVEQYPDSLDCNESVQLVTIETSSSHRYQTANNFLWNTSEFGNEFYDSIDSNLDSSLYQQNGEDMAECDSLEKRYSDTSDDQK